MGKQIGTSTDLLRGTCTAAREFGSLARKLDNENVLPILKGRSPRHRGRCAGIKDAVVSEAGTATQI